MYKFLVLAAALAVANAGYLGGYAAAPAYATGYAAPAYATYAHAAPAAITSQSSNILRSFGNLGQVSTYTKTVDTPYSSVRKSDVRVSNPGVATVAAAPAYAATYAAPAAYAAHGYAAPAIAAHGYAAPAVARAGLLGVAYSAAPVVSHISFDGLGAHYAW